ncbi:unnamed protein product [Zymoseptoria tritici ST99CH_1A5]|uniref:Uncharacterized protein n=1 Tax=Zymoseptoria tritici ST99CH_1A5 TaxID=1276529 RepID=A0A1Y6M2D3_ZYMTR|nr:unnamed protein product [Zymoseptoria tritici ST99CH_1A5]
MDNKDIACTDSNHACVTMDNEGIAYTVSNHAHVMVDNKDIAHTGLRTHNPQANLQGIAPELRLLIYEALWTPKDRKYTIHTDDPERRISQRQRQDLREVAGNRKAARHHTALLRVNKQIYKEAVAIMHRNTDLAMWFYSCRSGRTWPVRYRTPTVNAESCITSIRLSADLTEQLPLVVRFEEFPCLEKLQVMVKGRRGGSMTTEVATDTVCELIEKCSANAKLKSIAIEMSCSSLLTLQDLHNAAAADRACDLLQKRLQRVMGDMGKSAVVEVLWSRGSVY